MKIHKKHYYYIAGGIILAVVIFYAGMMAGKAQVGQATAMGGQQRGNLGGGFTARNGISQNGGVSAGQVISVDSQGITIQLRDGSSKIILIPSSASISIVKPQTGTMADLKTGINVTVNGTTNSDGSITAQMVQIRQIIPGQGQPGQASGSARQ